MTRRDVIIVSVLLNAGLLGILFLTAVKSDPDIVSDAADPVKELVAQVDDVPLPPITIEEEGLQQPLALQPVDEVDHMLREYLPEVPLETVTVELPAEPAPKATAAAEPKKEVKGQMVEVTVKRGDALEKIARANHTTVEAIKAANGMKNDKLKIGQVLQIPVGTKPAQASAKHVKEAEPIAAASPSEAVYYTIKSGDNPWKIAKQFHVKFEDLLKLNQLDEDSGRNLKVGDKIRVK